MNNMENNKKYTLAGVNTEIELGKDGIRVSNLNNEELSFKNENCELINLQIANAVQDNHAITKEQLDILASRIQKNSLQGPFYPVTSLDVDLEDGNTFLIDLRDAISDITLDLSNAVEGYTYLILVKQGPVAFNLNFVRTTKWHQGSQHRVSSSSEYRVSSAENSVDILQFLYVGDIFFGNSGLDYSS